MSVLKKLQEARVRLLDLELKKSGKNKFVGFGYFELADFLPSVTRIFNDLGLCGVVSFSGGVAFLEIYNLDVEPNQKDYVTFQSPMGSADLKGCHEVQNIGAVQTYHRRYLYVLAMDIVEHDALDSTLNTTTKSEEAPKKATKKPSSFGAVSDGIVITEGANPNVFTEGSTIEELLQKGLVAEAYSKYKALPSIEARKAAWDKLDDEARSQLIKVKKQESENE